MKEPRPYGATACYSCGREWADCNCQRYCRREDDRRRAERHQSETEDQYPSWDDVIRAMEGE